MPKYIVCLPKEIPDYLFDNLGGNVHNGIKRNLSKSYDKLAKSTRTEAESPQQAVGHLLFRELGRGLTASYLTKMFVPEAGRFVCGVPERPEYDDKGKRLSLNHAKTFQAMEIALEMADIRDSDPRDCYSEAMALSN